MGKASRRERRQAGQRIRIDEAARLLDLAKWWASVAKRPPSARVDPGDRWAAEVTDCVLGVWEDDRVVLRVDADFVGALLDADRRAEVPAEWLDRFPFRSVAVALAEPLTVNDGRRVCTYYGFLASGVRRRHLGTPLRPIRPHDPDVSFTSTFTTYHPIPEGEGVRFVWLFVDDAGVSGAQTLSPYIGASGSERDTIAELVEKFESVYQRGAGEPGQELEVLVPLSMLLLLYLASSEPDVEDLPPERIRRTQPLIGARVADVGWRVGAAIRSWRRQSGTEGEAGPGGWRLPPHIRSAHWHRVRVARRDEGGVIVGSVRGEYGVDWDYQLRWYPPTPVNVGAEGPAPVVRSLPSEPR